MPTAPSNSSKTLNTWKEVAGYLGKGVRTVQRWERKFGLPVRRVGGNARHNTVIAFTTDLDSWLQNKSHLLSEHSGESGSNGGARRPARGASVDEGYRLRNESRALQARIEASLNVLIARLHEAEDLVRECAQQSKELGRVRRALRESTRLQESKARSPRKRAARMPE